MNFVTVDTIYAVKETYFEDWLGEPTRRARRSLLIAALISMATALTHTNPSRIDALGIEVTELAARWLPWLFFALLAYLVLEFHLYAARDKLRLRTALEHESASRTRSLGISALKASSSPTENPAIVPVSDIESQRVMVEATQKLVEAFNDTLQQSEKAAKRQLKIRFHFDVTLPIVFAYLAILMTLRYALW